MPKMKVAELVGQALDWAVAQCEGFTLTTDSISMLVEKGGRLYALGSSNPPPTGYSPSSFWVQGGPIIERERIELGSYADQWQATAHLEGGSIFERADSLLIAAMRCYAASKLGNEVEIPASLL